VLLQLPAAVQLPRKWQQTSDKDRLEKRRCQLNHYFAELSGWANREGLDLWNPAVSKAFTDFIFGTDEDTEEERSSLRASALLPLDPQGGGGAGGQRGSSGSGAAGGGASLDSWEDSYATIRRERHRTTSTAPQQPPARLGSFAFGVSQSVPSHEGGSGSGSGGGGGGGVSPPVSSGASGKHFFHLQSPLKT
jgi:hypothetical protein